MRKMIVLISLLCGALFMSARQGNQQQRPPERQKPEGTEWYYPVPPKVKPGVGTSAPSDTVILFDGKDLSTWKSAGKDGGPARWAVEDRAMAMASGTGSIRTEDYFGDYQSRIEFKTPTPGKDNTLQMKGNSGIMLQSRYEVQVSDCEDNPTYVNGWVGSIYKQSTPLVSTFTKTNEWQVYDIYWKAPRLGTNDELESPAMITVVLNGIVVQNSYVLRGTTPYTGLPKYVAHGRLPLSLQGRGVEVTFRSIWVRNLQIV